jgi:molybdenum cofactor cytidylyltransferase
MSHCGIVILAAGGSSRLGRPKQLLELAGKTLLRRAVDTALASSCRPVFVVLGSQSDELAGPIAGMPVTILFNPDWPSGIASSIRVGIAAARRESDAAVLMLCDQPFVTSAAIDRLVQRHEAGGKAICAAAYEGTLGTPALFDASLFGELLELSGQEGGKKIIQRHAAEVEGVDLPEAAADIDTEVDFIRAMKASPDSIQ